MFNILLVKVFHFAEATLETITFSNCYSSRGNDNPVILDRIKNVEVYSNKVQLSICVCTVVDDLNVHKNFLGYYEIPNIKSETIVAVVKEALIRLQLALVAEILKEQPKAVPTHCHAHSLSLSVKDTCKNVDVLNNIYNKWGQRVKFVC